MVTRLEEKTTEFQMTTLESANASEGSDSCNAPDGQTMHNLSLGWWVPVAFVSLMMVLALIGNSLVLFVYNCRWRSVTAMKVYVSGLAILDLISVVVIMPSDLFNLLQTTFPFDPTIICQINKLASFSFSMACGCILTVIAISRYLKVTQIDTAYGISGIQSRRSLLPNFARRITSVRGAKIACVTAFCVSLLPSFPALFFYKNVYDVSERNESPLHRGPECLYRYICKLNAEYAKSQSLMAFNSIFIITFIIVLVTLIILYTKTAKIVWKSANQEQRCSSFNVSKHFSQYQEPSSSETKSEASNPKITFTRVDCNQANEESESVCIDTTYLPPLSYSNREISSSTISLRNLETKSIFNKHVSTTSFEFSKHGNKAKRTTLVLILITAIFIMSYLPLIFLLMSSAINGPDWINKKFDLPGRIVVEILRHSNLISNAFNPFIYSICNSHFRSTLWKVIFCRREIL